MILGMDGTGIFSGANNVVYPLSGDGQSSL